MQSELSSLGPTWGIQAAAVGRDIIPVCWGAGQNEAPLSSFRKSSCDIHRIGQLRARLCVYRSWGYRG